MRSTRRRLKQRGFTLIELLIVTSIICLLGALLYPVFARARQKGFQYQCQHNLRELGVALNLYAYEAGSRFPPTDTDYAALEPFLPDRRILACPTVRESFAGDVEKAISASYEFKGGLTLDESPRIVAADERNKTIHSEGVNCLFLDGHVRWIKTLRRNSAGLTLKIGAPLIEVQ